MVFDIPNADTDAISVYDPIEDSERHVLTLPLNGCVAGKLDVKVQAFDEVNLFNLWLE